MSRRFFPQSNLRRAGENVDEVGDAAVIENFRRSFTGWKKLQLAVRAAVVIGFFILGGFIAADIDSIATSLKDSSGSTILAGVSTVSALDRLTPTDADLIAESMVNGAYASATFNPSRFNLPSECVNKTGCFFGTCVCQYQPPERRVFRPEVCGVLGRVCPERVR
jgi:hypothetical protein